MSCSGTKHPSDVRVDALSLARELIRCPSVTPADAGALDVLEQTLVSLGFQCWRLPFSDPDSPTVDNLFARYGQGAPHYCFAGHTDVVPPGDIASWSVDPFAAEIVDDRLYGRGAADMKAAIACFVSAVDRLLRGQNDLISGTVSLLITGDEEGPAVNGTRKVLNWLADRGEALDGCLIGEPTNPNALGEMIKIGRRGSLNASIWIEGVQGHAAYPQLADNPIPRMARLVTELVETQLDEGTTHFQPSVLTITSVDVGNPAANVIPASAQVKLNIRFNDSHSYSSLRQWLDDHCRAIARTYRMETHCSGEPFLCKPGTLARAIVGAVESLCGQAPELSTSGGTSDGRFIATYCPVVEFGMPGATAHKVNESIAVSDVDSLTAIYASVLERLFNTNEH